MNSRTLNNLKKIDRFVFKHFYDQYWKILEKEIQGSETLLDLGCGALSPVVYFKHKHKYTLGVDIFEPSLKQSKKKSIHSDYLRLDILNIDNAIKNKSFDCVLASDLLEHLSKKDGRRFLSAIENIATKKVIVFTPNGFIEQNEYNGNKYQTHLSGWAFEQMKKLGYRVIGVNGWKGFFGVKGERAEVVWRPRIFWGKISFLSQAFMQIYPRHAFQLLCVKEVQS